MFFVYLLAGKPNGTLYVGVTSDLARRVSEHKNKAAPGFTAKYGVDRLMWFYPPEPGFAAQMGPGFRRDDTAFGCEGN